jgi:hypothetical protein
MAAASAKVLSLSFRHSCVPSPGLVRHEDQAEPIRAKVPAKFGPYRLGDFDKAPRR